MSLTTGLIDLLPPHGRLHKYDDRAAWIAGRKGRIGGGKIGSLYGFAYGEDDALYALWAQEIGLLEPSEKDNGNMRRGRGFERPILEDIAEQQGWAIEHWPQNWVVFHPDETLRFGATPDGLAVIDAATFNRFFGVPADRQPVAVQVKSASPWAKKKWPRDENGQMEVPAHHIPQVQAELDCLGLEFGLLVVLFGLNFDDIEIIPYRRSTAFCASMHERLRWFWELVDNQEKPPATPTFGLPNGNRPPRSERRRRNANSWRKTP
jgi:hypothetical protein